jgi:molybdate transport system ATP-binding protein
LYSNIFSGSVETVSLERAAALIEEERRNDESDYIEGGVDSWEDQGRKFLGEVLHGDTGRLWSWIRR